jgi:hypothetical protein
MSENFAYQHLKYLKGSLTCRKILRHETSGFVSHPKEGVLRIFIALKNPSPRPGLNPRPLGPVVSILTTTPLRLQTIDRDLLLPLNVLGDNYLHETESFLEKLIVAVRKFAPFCGT